MENWGTALGRRFLDCPILLACVDSSLSISPATWPAQKYEDSDDEDGAGTG